MALYKAENLANITLDLVFYGRKLGACVFTMIKVSTVLGDAHCEVRFLHAYLCVQVALYKAENLTNITLDLVFFMAGS